MNIDDLIAANPFPGLRSFKRDEADRFFGREQQINDLAAMLDTSSLIAVAGASGCGKSSLVLAGLLHRLEENRLVHGEKIEWRPVVLRPGNSPIANLAEKLAIQLDPASINDEYRVASLGGQLRLGGLALVEVIRLARLEPNVRILVIVDQFEEIFRFKQMTDPEEAAAFVKLLLNAANDRSSPVNVILTLRTDQLGRCADFRDLPEAVSRGQYLVPRLTREQRKVVIIKPVELRGFKVAPRLVQRILNDVTDDYDDLPVMQHVLTRTWWKWAENCQGNREIDLEDYEKAGTAVGALSDHANEAYDSLIGLSDVVERVFRALTERTDESTGTGNRRPLNFMQLCAVVGYDEASVKQVVDRFRRPDTAFLMPSPEIDLNSNPVIDISHESLIRQWQKLCQWVITEAEAFSELKRLVDAAHQYSQKNADLWRGRVLERALNWHNREHPNPAWIKLYFEKADGVALLKSVQTFITESKQASDSERNRSQRLLWALRSLVVIVVIVSVGAAYNAITMQKKTKSRQLLNQSLLELGLSPARSAHLALAAINLDPDNPRAEFALRQSLAMHEIAYTEHIISFDEPIIDARITKDGSRLVVANGKSVQILDTQNYEKPGNGYVRDKNVTKAWLIANNTFLVTLTEDGQGQIQPVDGDSITPLTCKGDANNILSFAISLDEQHIAAGCYKGEIVMWNVRGMDVTQQPLLAAGDNENPISITALNFSADSQYLASGDADGKITIWKLGISVPWVCLKQENLDNDVPSSSVINSIGFHPDYPELLATASDNHTAIVWEFNLNLKGCSAAEEKDKPSSWKLKHDRPVTMLQFTPRKDSPASLMTISDKRVSFWSNVDRKEERRHNDWVRDANVSDDGEFVVSASSDGTARIWLARSGVPIATLRGHRDEVTRAFLYSKDQIITTSWDKSLRIWRFHPSKLTLLAAENRWLLSAAFDTEGQQIALCGEDNASEKHCSIFSLSSNSQMKELDPADTFDAVAYASWSADNRFLAGLKYRHGLFNSTVEGIYWDTQTGKVVEANGLGQVLSAEFNIKMNELITVDYHRVISVWDTAALLEDNPEPKLSFAERFNRSGAVMSPDGRWIAAIEYNEISLFDRNSPKSEARKLIGHHGNIMTAKFSHDSQRLVTASKDRIARIWNVNQSSKQSEACAELVGHTAALSSAAFNPAGTQVVTSSADHTIRVWDAQHCHELTTLYWHSDSVNEVQFSPDGQSILSASDDGTVILGRCETCNQTLEELRERVRNEAKLSADELEKLHNEIKLLDFKLSSILE